MQEVALWFFMCPWALSRPWGQYPVHTGSPGALQCRSSSPSVFLCMFLNIWSLPSGGYLIRPSLLTGPSSDLGSGDRELQEVLKQGPSAGQEEVCVVHRLPVIQKVLTLSSTHASRDGPTSWALRWASCIADSWGASFSMELSCWKLCSRYRFPGGPAWSQLSSSEVDGHIWRQREIERGKGTFKKSNKTFQMSYHTLNLRNFQSRTNQVCQVCLSLCWPKW